MSTMEEYKVDYSSYDPVDYQRIPYNVKYSTIRQRSRNITTISNVDTYWIQNFKFYCQTCGVINYPEYINYYYKVKPQVFLCLRKYLPDEIIKMYILPYTEIVRIYGCLHIYKPFNRYGYYYNSDDDSDDEYDPTPYDDLDIHWPKEDHYIQWKNKNKKKIKKEIAIFGRKTKKINRILKNKRCSRKSCVQKKIRELKLKRREQHRHLYVLMRTGQTKLNHWQWNGKKQHKRQVLHTIKQDYRINSNMQLQDYLL